MSLLELHFLRPAWLLALLPLAVLLWWLTRRRPGRGHWARVCDTGLLPFVLHETDQRPRLWPLLLVGCTGLTAILALSGPSWDRLQQPLYHDTRALVIALDLSRAMDAADLEPSRLARARYKIADVLAERREGVTGLIVYAGEAFTVTPLSTDTATISAQLGVLTTDLMPVPGHRADRALSLARDLFRQAGYRHGDILLVTTGADSDRLQPLATELRGEGFRLSILGVGTETGAPIPAEPHGYLRDRAGAIVIPRLDPAALSALAAAGGGLYQTLRPDGRDVERLLAHFSGTAAGSGLTETGFDAEVWLDRGPWLVLLLLPLALLAFRRGLIMGLALAVCLPYVPDAAAGDWSRLWLSEDQRGIRALADGEPERAIELFRDPEWRAIAGYRAGDYAAALETLAGLDTARSWYNRGNAYARLGRYRQAIDAYDQALEREPGLEDARYNRNLLRALLQESQPELTMADEAPLFEPEAQDGDDGDTADDGLDDGPRDGDGLGDGQPTEAPGDMAATDPGLPAADADGQPEQAGPDGERLDADTRDRGMEADSDMLERPVDERAVDETVAAPDAVAGDIHTARSWRQDDEWTGDEQYAIDEQWLRLVEDDPGGLLRRKFLHQYRQRHLLQPYYAR